MNLKESRPSNPANGRGVGGVVIPIICRERHRACAGTVRNSHDHGHQVYGAVFWNVRHPNHLLEPNGHKPQSISDGPIDHCFLGSRINQQENPLLRRGLKIRRTGQGLANGDLDQRSDANKGFG